jgi:hypothetical protein
MGRRRCDWLVGVAEHVLMETTERNTLKPGEVAYGLVAMWQDQSICAELWYRTHLNAPARAGRGGAPAPVYTEATCKVPKSEHSFPSVEKVGTRRQPGGGAAFGPVSLNWFVSPSDTPLAPTRGQLVDHIAVSVPALDPWIAKLEAENVTFLQAAVQVRRQSRHHDRGREPRIDRDHREVVDARVYVAGHAIGGMVAFALALEHPSGATAIAFL